MLELVCSKQLGCRCPNSLPLSAGSYNGLCSLLIISPKVSGVDANNVWTKLCEQDSDLN